MCEFGDNAVAIAAQVQHVLHGVVAARTALGFPLALAGRTAAAAAERGNRLAQALAIAVAEGRAAGRVEVGRIVEKAFPLIGATIGLFQITDGRSYETASQDFATANGVISVQRDFRYLLQEQKAGQGEGDPAQYALARLRLPEAHTLAHGANVLVAVIDSGIDARHPELAGSVTDSFDALGTAEAPHVHGTGIAGVIASHARLMGAAPSAHLMQSALSARVRSAWKAPAS
jgi:subtilisin family serine protease